MRALILFVFSSCTYQAQKIALAELGDSDAGDATSVAADWDERGDAQTAGDSFIAPLKVLPVYPNNADWTAYVVNNPALGMYEQRDQPCIGDEPTAASCIHAGELRKVVVPTASSCSDLALHDEIGAFDWFCISSAGTVIFFSQLKRSHGLRDLIVSDSWRANYVTLTSSEGTQLASSEPAIWWSNEIVPLPSGTSVTILSLPWTIYTHATASSMPGYHIDADHISVVTLDDRTLKPHDSIQQNCNYALGTDDDANTICLISSDNQRFLWIEADLNAATPTGTHANAAINLRATAFSRIHRTYAAQSFADGITVEGNANRFSQLHTESQLGAGVVVMGAGAHLEDIVAANNGAHGISIIDGSLNRGRLLTAYNNAGAGVHILRDAESSYVGILAANNTSDGVSLETTTRSVLKDVLAVNNDADGVRVYGGGYNTLVHVVAVNNQMVGISLDTSAGTKLAQIASGNNLWGFNIQLYYAQDTFFTANLLVTLGNCSITTSTGLNYASCTPEAPSNATRRIVELTYSFVAKVTTNDLANDSETNGTALTVTDWFNFEHPLRNWGADGGTFPHESNTGRCGQSASICRIWDWRLLADPVDTTSPLYDRSGNGSTVNEPFLPNAPCPAHARGNFTISDQRSNPQTFLLNATELRHGGDGDGLCESDERCIYSPNFGPYQGHGELTTEPCTFGGNSVTGVNLYGRQQNGM